MGGCVMITGRCRFFCVYVHQCKHHQELCRSLVLLSCYLHELKVFCFVLSHLLPAFDSLMCESYAHAM
uniref:Uncharacterized protein n=1 Tax=Arundo donax TaxID=35708 RepID=A0A0A9CSJ5_ARUDO